MSILSNKPLLLLGGYAVSVNIGAAGLFFYDKQQAIAHKWRVPEKTLHLTGLLGGWIGGMWAMQQFKHKRSKQSFKNVYYTAVATNIGIIGASVLILKRFPQFIPNQLKPFLNQQQQQQYIQPIKRQSQQQPQQVFESVIEEQQQPINKKKRNGKKNKNNI